ncbi:nephrin-like [Mytilus edulis]|uniref:nephrin-like n=1 Tax=Mytilus edulis TaxID=6550 RepID=UPI0039EEE013
MYIIVLIAANDGNTCAKKNGTITNVFSSVGSTIVLECHMHNFDSVPSWSLQGVSLSDGNIIYKSDKRFKIVEGLRGNRFNLQISNLMKADEDKYCCEYIYQYKSIENCTLLHLEDISIIPNESKVITRPEGSTITLSCLFPSNVPGFKTISWISNGTIQHAKDTNILNLTVLLTLDLNGQNQSCRGLVHCINMSFESVIQFNVTYSPKMKVNMIQSSLLRESDQVRLTCVYESNPAPSVIIWTHNDIIIQRDFEYYIHNISRREDGVYQCKVKNAIGYGVDEIKLSVQYAPEVHVELLPNSSLLCNATGFPNNYTFSNWEHMSIDSFRSINNAINLLKFDFNDDDNNPVYTFDGLYVCKVSNGIPDVHNITMQLGFKDVYFPGKPYCIPQNNTEIRERTEPVTITFIVYSRTPVNYTWQKGHFQLKGSSKYKYQINQTSTPVKIHGVLVNLTTLTVGLLIYNLTYTDFDTVYTVYLSNKHGNSSCSNDLLKGTVPDKPSNLTVKPLLVSFEVTWNAGFNGRYPQSFTINYRSIMDQNWTTIAILSNERHKKVQGLLENMKYLVYMYALNVIGKSDNTDNVTIQTLESHAISTRQSYSINLVAYISTCFCCTIIILLVSAFYARFKKIVYAGQNKKETKNSKRADFCRQHSVYEEVVLNPADNGQRFIIITSSPA